MNNFKSMKYKILFIDEEKNQHDNFLDYMDKIEDKVEVKCLYPEENMDMMLQIVEDEHPDAIVADYQLNEMKTEIQYNVSYNGAELVNAYREKRPNFPCFVITSYDNDAISTSKDVNLVYVKILMNGGEGDAKAKFHDKIVEQVCKYKKAINDAQTELTVLIQKKHEKCLSLHEEDRLVELDSFLEKSLDSYSTIPADIKRSKSLEHLSEAIDKVDEILAKLG